MGNCPGSKRYEFVRTEEVVVLEWGFVYLADDPVFIRTVSTRWIKCLGLCIEGVIVNIFTVFRSDVGIIEWCLTTCKKAYGYEKRVKFIC